MCGAARRGIMPVQIGKDGYYLSADGYLMPLKKGRQLPDLRYFNQVGNQANK